MTDLANKNLHFLSDKKLINVLKSVFTEIDLVAGIGADRSTTYLAVSAIEGLFGEILKLKNIEPKNGRVPQNWPVVDGKPKERNKLTLGEKIDVLQADKALPTNFELLFHPLRDFRNYIHMEVELTHPLPITSSVAHQALACLDAVIEKYESLRVVAGHEWRLEEGYLQVAEQNALHMLGTNSLLVSEEQANSFQGMTFRVKIPRDAIFNFIYNYRSKDQFMGARIEGRDSGNGRGCDNGQLSCKKWKDWDIIAKYTDKSEPKPQLREHNVQIILGSSKTFALIVDGEHLELQDGIRWGFNPKYKIGFLTEVKQVSILDLKLQT